MITNLTLQIIASFFIGGGFISFLAFWAERSSGKISGIILMLPSTMVLGFFFLALNSNALNVSAIVPATLIPLGVLVISSVFYIYTAQFFETFIRIRNVQILATFLVCNILWLVLSLPFAIWRFHHLLFGLLVYLIITIVAHLILNRQENHKPVQKTIYTRTQMVLRACFVGLILSVVVVVGKLLNPFWGGVMSMYPAATFTALMVIHKQHATQSLFYFFRKAPLGSLLLCIYALSVHFLFPLFGFVFGTIVSYGICIFFAFVLVYIQQFECEISRKGLKVQRRKQI